MRLEGEPCVIDVGAFVMNCHHGLLRMGVVASKRVDQQGWTQCKVNWLEDDIYEAHKAWGLEIDSDKVYSDETRVDYLKPVSPKWLHNVLGSYGRYKNEQRTKNG
jgi:hypothetical protein